MPCSGSTTRLILTMALISSFSATGFIIFFVMLAMTPTSSSSSMSAALASAVPKDVGTVIYTTTTPSEGDSNNNNNKPIQIEIDFFSGGVIRMRARTVGGDTTPFQVTDVVVGKKLAPPRQADLEPEERVSIAPPGTYICGSSSTSSSTASSPTGKVDACKVTSPCGTTHMTIAVVSSEKIEFSYAHKTRGVLAQGNVNPLGGPVGEVIFPQANALYGIPERAIDLSLKAGGSYRLMNLDVFEYKLDSQSGIYGSIPFLMAHGASGSSTTGVLWLNGGDTTVETKLSATTEAAAGGTPDPTQPGWYSKWISKWGLPDLFFFPGPTPRDVQRQHAAVVGPTMLPPLFSLGYHQCRWNYRTEDDLLEVNRGFDTHGIPADVMWLDIEHTDGKRYFTWDKHNFPNPKEMINKVASTGRKVVTIIDPHIKVDDNYYVHKEAKAKGFYIKNEGGSSDFEGHCWPGTSSWVDFYNSEARKWYATLFHYDRYEGSTPDLYVWQDMNEMSVFNQHEVTMSPNNVQRHADGTQVNHGALHNMYGFYNAMAGYDGQILRNSIAPYVQKRPFILTRSFFSGSQRYAAMWTGDNMARWDHLEKSLPMLLALSLSNFIFVGADVGGFFGNPDAQLMTRWYQAGAFYPFFRGHAHLETKRREPWLFGEETTKRIRDAITMRYTLLPYMYTQFFLAHDHGDTVMQPLFYNFPDMLHEQRAYTVGPALLSCPVTKENAETHEVPLPAASNWYAYPSGTAAVAGTIPVTIDSIPVYLRGGHIIPTRLRSRRSTAGTVNDPLTLYVAVAADGTNSVGFFYHDDGDTFEYKEKGAFLMQEFVFDATKKQLVGRPVGKAPGSGRAASAEFAASKSHIVVERVVLFGMKGAADVKKVAVTSSGRGGSAAPAADIDIEYDAEAGVLTVNRPNLSVTEQWSLALE